MQKNVIPEFANANFRERGRGPLLQFLFEIQHTLQGQHGSLAQFRIDENFGIAAIKYLIQCLQFIHGHPRAVGAAVAGSAVTGGGSDDQFLVGNGFLHGMENTLIGGDDERWVIHLDGGIDDLAGRTDPVGQFDHRFG